MRLRTIISVAGIIGIISAGVVSIAQGAGFRAWGGDSNFGIDSGTITSSAVYNGSLYIAGYYKKADNRYYNQIEVRDLNTGNVTSATSEPFLDYGNASGYQIMDFTVDSTGLYVLVNMVGKSASIVYRLDSNFTPIASNTIWHSLSKIIPGASGSNDIYLGGQDSNNTFGIILKYTYNPGGQNFSYKWDTDFSGVGITDSVVNDIALVSGSVFVPGSGFAPISVVAVAGGTSKNNAGVFGVIDSRDSSSGAHLNFYKSPDYSGYFRSLAPTGSGLANGDGGGVFIIGGISGDTLYNIREEKSINGAVVGFDTLVNTLVTTTGSQYPDYHSITYVSKLAGNPLDSVYLIGGYFDTSISSERWNLIRYDIIKDSGDLELDPLKGWQYNIQIEVSKIWDQTSINGIGGDASTMTIDPNGPAIYTGGKSNDWHIEKTTFNIKAGDIIRADHVNALRSSIEKFRSLFGLTTVWSTPIIKTGTAITQQQFIDLQNNITNGICLPATFSKTPAQDKVVSASLLNDINSKLENLLANYRTMSRSQACGYPSRVFVTSQTWNGDLGASTGADADCQATASAAGLSGTWEAWLSNQSGTSGSTSPNSRFYHNPNGYVLLDASRIADSWNDLITQSTVAGYEFIKEPINLTETGVRYTGATQVYVWTNTGPGGGIHYKSRTDSCDNWNTTDLGSWSGDIGLAEDQTEWSSYTTMGCTGNAHLYCFEQ